MCAFKCSNYSDVYTYDDTKAKNCIDCQKVFADDDKVIHCVRYCHIFHEKCWSGVCSTNICKKEASERFWEPINQTIGGVLALGMMMGIIGLFAYLENTRR